MARKTWGQLSPAYRDRLARAFQRQGISRETVRAKYNRGTLGPVTSARGHAKTPERPERASRNPQKYREYINKRTIIDRGPLNKRALALQHIRTKIAHYYKYNDSTVVANVNAMSGSELDWTLRADTESIRARASIQHAGYAPWWTDPDKSNPWFYH
jgi:hypothetical protein